ncbi:MAG TPA: IS4 family transposase, partial [Anaerolineales bacterium]
MVQWPKPKKPPSTISPAEWALLPQVLTLRLVRCRLQIPGFRTRQILLATTLLDSTQYSAAALGQLYYRRRAMELTLRQIKTTLQ